MFIRPSTAEKNKTSFFFPRDILVPGVFLYQGKRIFIFLPTL
jgi:hypothetical protein